MSWFKRKPGNNRVPAPAPRPVQAIVYAHGPADSIRDCLQSLLETFRGEEILVVQDTREPAACDFLAKFMEEQRGVLIQNLDLLGYQRSVLKALRASDAEFRVVIDSDAVATAGGLRDLAEELSFRPEAELALGLLDIQLGRNDGAMTGGDAERIAAALAGDPAVKDLDLGEVAFSGHPCFAVRRSALPKLTAWETIPTGLSATSEVRLAGRCLPACFARFRGNRDAAHFASSLQAVVATLTPGICESIEAALTEARRLATCSGRRVLFLLPSPGGSGGAHSVVQEVAGLRRCGVEAWIVNRPLHENAFRQNYPDVADFCLFPGDEELAGQVRDGDAVIATSHGSVPMLKTITDRKPTVIPLYYIQDYEPWFYAEHDPRHAAAKASYSLVPGLAAFAKTRWLCDTLRRLEGIDVAKVEPSLDRALYNGLVERPRREGPATVAAMVRPSSPRRNPRETLDVLNRLYRSKRRQVDIRVFGCQDEDLDQLEEAAGFRFVNLGELKNREVADVLRGADIFVDLSRYQAFGRTGLEAMAVGCATVLPRGSGPEEYAVHGENSLLVDTADPDEALEAIIRLVDDRDLMRQIQQNARETGRRYSVRTAAWSQLKLFCDIFARYKDATGERSNTIAE